MDPSARAFGLQLTVRASTDPARSAAGDLRAIDPATTTILCEDNQTRVAGPCRAEAPIQFFLHTEPRRTGVFEIEWTPPAANLGAIDVYIAANASVSGQRNSRIHLRSVRLTPSAPAAARLVDAAAGLPRFSSGSWISVYGGNLTTTTRVWSPGDIVNGVLPTRLGGVELRINGRAAALSYVSPTQINALAPDDPALGEARFEVLQNGLATASATARKNALAPALFEEPGSSRVAAARAAGDALVLFGTGFGSPERDMGSVQFRIAGQPARVLWAGVIGPGLFQFNLAPPPLPPGEYSLDAHIQGVATQPGLALRLPAQ